MKSTDYSKFVVECTTNYTPKFIEYVIELYRDYGIHGKQKAENYTPDRIRSNFNQDRFGYGFYIVKYEGSVVASFGVDQLERWAVITRYLRHTKSNILESWFFFGVCYPFVIEHLQNQIDGVCWTRNMGMQDFTGIMVRRFPNKQKQNYLFERAANYINKIQKVPGTVLYRGVEQSAHFIPLNQSAPPFKQIN